MRKALAGIVVGMCLAVFVAGCGAELEMPALTAEQALAAVHGPMACNGPIPEYGHVDLFSGDNLTGTCVRIRGDFGQSSGHVGYTFTPPFAVRSFRTSPRQASETAGYAGLSLNVCKNTALSTDSWCRKPGQPATAYGSGAVVNTLPWTPGSMTLGYFAYCPYFADQIAVATGAPLPWPHFPDGGSYMAPRFVQSCGYVFDGSGMSAWMGFDAFGHVTAFLPNATGQAVECIGYDSASTWVVMVYSC